MKLIQSDDFVTANISIALHNRISNTHTDPNSPSPTIEEIGADYVILNIPHGFCSMNHKINFGIRISNLSKIPYEADLLTCVTEIERMSRTSDRLKLKIEDTQGIAWKSLLSLFSKRQVEIDGFFKAARGY